MGTVFLRYGEPISIDEFESQFLSQEEGASRLAVKRLTKRLELEMMRLTVNAPDWSVLFP
jgi:glycerol-3-phosphate O-acyltransferase/dihydroxyacetone phosphate acyltransferase